jgi:hypothetical protein
LRILKQKFGSKLCIVSELSSDSSLTTFDTNARAIKNFGGSQVLRSLDVRFRKLKLSFKFIKLVICPPSIVQIIHAQQRSNIHSFFAATRKAVGFTLWTHSSNA